MKGIYQVKDGVKKLMADVTDADDIIDRAIYATIEELKKLPIVLHGHEEGSPEGQVHWRDIEGAPPMGPGGPIELIDHNHSETQGGFIPWEHIEGRPTWLGGGGMSEDEYERIAGNFRLGQIINTNNSTAPATNGPFGNNICYITRIEFLVYVTHIRTATSGLSNNMIFGMIPEGYRPNQDILTNASAQGQSGNMTGNVRIRPNGEMRWEGGSTPTGGSGTTVMFSTIWLCNTMPLPQQLINPLSTGVTI